MKITSLCWTTSGNTFWTSTLGIVNVDVKEGRKKQTCWYIGTIEQFYGKEPPRTGSGLRDELRRIQRAGAQAQSQGVELRVRGAGTRQRAG